MLNKIIHNSIARDHPKKELWKPVKGYEGLYEVSNLGGIKSLARWRKNGENSGYWQQEKILKQTHTTTGYLKVELSKNKKRSSFKVHRLVAEAFIANPDNKPNINHKDGNPLNNKAENLEWCTQQENIIHALRTGLKKKLHIPKEELKHLYIDKNLTAKEIGEMYNVTAIPILAMLKRYGIKKENPRVKYNLTKEKLLEGLKTKSQTELAREIGCDKSLISIYLKRIKEKGYIYAQ